MEMGIRKRSVSVGTRIYLSVMGVFLVFAVAFIVFQQTREKQFKTDMLNLRLQDYNQRMDDVLHAYGRYDEKAYDHFVDENHMKGLRVTIITRDGSVVYDNRNKGYAQMGNHANRPEVRTALRKGAGSTVERNSRTMGGDYFYSATYFEEDSLDHTLGPAVQRQSLEIAPCRPALHLVCRHRHPVADGHPLPVYQPSG